MPDIVLRINLFSPLRLGPDNQMYRHQRKQQSASHVHQHLNVNNIFSFRQNILISRELEPFIENISHGGQNRVRAGGYGGGKEEGKSPAKVLRAVSL